MMLIFVIGFVGIQLFQLMNTQEPITYSEVLGYFEENKVVEFNVDDTNLLTMVIKENADSETTQTISYQLKELEYLRDDIEGYLKDPDCQVTKFDYEPETELPVWVSFVPY